VDGETVVYRHTGTFGCERQDPWQPAHAIDPSGAGAAASSAAMAQAPSAQPLVPWSSPPAALQRLVEQLMATSGTYAVAVMHKGKLLESYSTEHGISADTRLHGWSMSKSLLSLLLGIRWGEGRIDPTAFARSPELSAASKAQANTTIDTLLNMRVGQPLSEPRGAPQMVWGEPNTASFAALTGPRQDVAAGSFYYSSGNTNVLSRELRYSFPEGPEGQAEYAAYPWTALFSRIDARSFTCDADPHGDFVFSSLCWATARDWLKLGQLVMQAGAWEGQQVVPAEWIHRTTEVVNDSHPIYTHGWYRYDATMDALEDPTIGAIGIRGQYIVVIPAKELVFVRLGMNELNLPIQDLVAALPA